MRYTSLGHDGITVSVIGIGTWVMGGDSWGSVDDQQSIAGIEAALDAGINLIDTAPSYGNGRAERIVGKAIKGKRDRVVIATKCGLRKKGKKFEISLKPADVREDLEGSLKRMGIERVDLFQCHWPDPHTPIEDTIGELITLKGEGIIRSIGVSNFDLNLMERCLAVARVASLQSHYSLLERNLETAILPFCRKRHVSVLSYGSLGGGILTGKYLYPPRLQKRDARSFFYRYYGEATWQKLMGIITELSQIADEHEKPAAQVALNWVLRRPGITCALTGIRSAEQAVTNAGTGEWILEEKYRQRLDAAVEQAFGKKGTL